ncbi:hypothetical protein [Maribellus sp. YY47]|uniref:hypothetical protein n=1 Tax=Maribellus sp. YY47 TaxID=2929486 RepID=UPI0020018007|nr:hypothetical protein [Maribellus sp. YY47]MCK3685085.1 hypothetical protein [Maribellus sp. YY47]
MQSEIPEPITFNPYKHHFRFLLGEIRNWNTPETIKEKLLPIGNNLTDFYLGKLDITEICSECKEFFTSQNRISFESFSQWMGGSEWKKIRLSDGSDWLIKMGEQENRYIHLHPAKFSKHSIRVQATTLKTVLALVATQTPLSVSPGINLSAVNQRRAEILDLSPIKALHPADSGILRLWNIFENANTNKVYP